MNEWRLEIVYSSSIDRTPTTNNNNNHHYYYDRDAAHLNIVPWRDRWTIDSYPTIKVTINLFWINLVPCDNFYRFNFKFLHGGKYLTIYNIIAHLSISWSFGGSLTLTQIEHMRLPCSLNLITTLRILLITCLLVIKNGVTELEMVRNCPTDSFRGRINTCLLKESIISSKL